jgi:prevent-host-death family protein
MGASEGTVKDDGDETRVGADDARPALGQLMDRAWDGERIAITRHERERAVLLGWRTYVALRALERESAAGAASAGTESKSRAGDGGVGRSKSRRPGSVRG